MDKLTKYQQIISQVLNPYLKIKYANVNLKNRGA